MERQWRREAEVQQRREQEDARRRREQLRLQRVLEERERRRQAQAKVRAREQARSATLRASAITGVVTSVADGDTVIVNTGSGQRQTVRLYGIDCPEAGQPFANEAKAKVNSLVRGQKVTVYKKGKDRYNRVIGWVFAGKQCVNRVLVEGGYAWHYARYAQGETKLAELHTAAKSRRVGLWAASQPVAPWHWRESRRSVTATGAPANAPANDASIDGYAALRWCIAGMSFLVLWYRLRRRNR